CPRRCRLGGGGRGTCRCPGSRWWRSCTLLLGTIVWPGPGKRARPLLLCGLRGLVRGQDRCDEVGGVLGHGAVVVGERGGADLVHGAADGHVVTARCWRSWAPMCSVYAGAIACDSSAAFIQSMPMARDQSAASSL